MGGPPGLPSGRVGLGVQPDGRLVVAIADVTGHGVGPALVMAVCRAYARATAPTIRSAREFLGRLNALIKDVTGGRFITMAVALARPDGSVDLLSAGHGPSFLFRAATGAVERFGGDGLPLGIEPGESYDPTLHLRLEPGDALLLLTDGFMERADPDGALFGIERLSRLITECGAEPPDRLIASLDQATPLSRAVRPRPTT